MTESAIDRNRTGAGGRGADATSGDAGDGSHGGYGGGVYCYYGNLTLIKSSVTANTTGAGDAALFKLMYAYEVGSGANCGVLGSAQCDVIAADYASIDVSSSGLAIIAYYGFIQSSDGNLRVAFQRFRSFLPLVGKNQ